MEKLFQTYSINDLFIFLILSALAIKGIITFFDWASLRLHQAFDKEYAQKEQREQVEWNIQENRAIINNLLADQKRLANDLEVLTKKVDILVASDKEAIKAFITREHHAYYAQGWVDDYSLECCERLFAHYKEEGGNSFIENFMKEMRKLPNRPPEKPKLDK